MNSFGKNEAEFFSVVSEYFFGRPQQVKENHPALYKLPEKVFCNQATG
ncbi:MAG TPA: zinc-dependent peptidase [Chitinophagaceae bacterium]|nr:zinc-dependent peptidase [Chitinophagaceae bacterium]